MAAGDVAGDGESEPGAAGRLIARAVQAEERAEHRLALGYGDARPVIVDGDLDGAIQPVERHLHASPMAAGVADEIADAALDRIGAERDGEPGRVQPGPGGGHLAAL